METFNKFLKKQGKVPSGAPLFKLVWSNSETELRSGTFEDYTTGGLFIRTFVGTRRVLKYNYIIDRWILEKWFPPELTISHELPDSKNGSYEPLYVFEDKKGNYLPPNLKALNFLIEQTRQPNRSTPEQLINALLEKEEKEVKEIEDSLDLSPIQNALHMGEGTGYGKNRGVQFHG
ncbi:MAG: hypothetical protein ACHQ1H_06190 [Nitrososphaerales archaeon]